MSVMIGVDPGPVETAWVLLENGKPTMFEKAGNAAVLHFLSRIGTIPTTIEMIASYGMPVGKEVFETCVWIGRYIHVAPHATRITRNMVKMAVCHSPKANDATIRTALIDRFGGKDAAIGKKAKPGPLYGMSGDVWAALAVAITAIETEARYAP